MTKDEALKMAMEWYDSGHEIREEYEAMIKTILAQRTWQGLTDEEIDTILKRGDVAEHDAWNGRWYVLPYSFAQSIEAKIKEKNT